MSPRGKVSIALIAFSGLRPESIGNDTGTDDLKLGDFVEVRVRPKGIKFIEVPLMLLVRRGLSKAGHHHFTFIPQQTINYIQEYIKGRVKTGSLKQGLSPLSFNPRGIKKNRFLRITLVIRDIKEAIKRVGFS